MRAESSGEAVLKTDDAGIVAVRPGASFVVERFSAQGRTTDHMTLRVLGGALRVMTGWIGRVNRSQNLIVTPTASIGIRGTDHEPYVVTPELAAAFAQAEGTYNKVNRGGTTLAAGGRSVDVTPGKVGFVRAASQQRVRALMTLLQPVLLDRIPDFYLPGQFESELDQLSGTTEDEAVRQFEERARTLPVESASTAPAPPSQTRQQAGPNLPPVAPQPVAQESALSVMCGASAVARNWLAQLDGAIARRETGTVLALFSPEATIRATVRVADGTAQSMDISRQAFVESSITALQGLTDFRQRRISVEAQAEPGQASCDRIHVKSLVLEQGTQNGRAYRVESIEEYVLERRAGHWLAVKAVSTQR